VLKDTEEFDRLGRVFDILKGVLPHFA
jgi:hypothetical protein